MTELFDMIAGSDTGAIVGSLLALPNNKTSGDQENRYFADTATQFFVDTKEFYISRTMPVAMRAGINFGFAGLVCLLVFICTNTASDKKRAQYEQKIIKLNQMLEEQEQHVLEKRGTFHLRHRKTLKTLVDENDDLHLHQMVIAAKSAIDSDKPLEVLKQEKQKIEQIQKEIQKKRIYKYVSIFAAFVLSLMISDYSVINVMNLLFFSNTDSTALYTKLGEFMS